MPFQDSIKFQGRIPLPTDSLNQPIREGDSVIIVIGLSGAGKSTFINKLFGQDVAKVGHDLAFQTTEPQYYTLRHTESDGEAPRYTHVIDTPGIDSGCLESSRIMMDIHAWLLQQFGKRGVDGIIFLHEITQGRQPGIVPRNLHLFCSNAATCIRATENNIIATTKWDDINLEKGLKRETELRDEWKDLLRHDGTRMRRLENSQASAIGLVNEIIAKATPRPCHIPKKEELGKDSESRVMRTFTRVWNIIKSCRILQR
ncbi:hypothetical protein H0H81_008317 [Sphagnurus paluster]|uniref:G domain-containing protein n=1 Tax=Sphagnurus paluster TaxID=117069 RepID=A0A9P7GPR8_9AGAR|nr:hypothetical protein H0H81_008317 [Sphagnurus paluster]